MYYQEFSPTPSLRPYIRTYAYLAHQPEKSGDQSIQNLFPPTLTKQLIVQLTSASALSGTNGVFSGPAPESYLSPHISRSFRITSSELFQLFAVVFRPGAFHAVFPIPLKAVEDQLPSLEDLQEFGLPQFGQQIQEAKSFAARVTIADAYFTNLLSQQGPVATRSQLVVNRMLRAPELSIHQQIKGLGIGERQFRRIFAREMGTSLKTFQRNARIIKALYLMNHASHLDLADISFLCGYYDPSHFTQDFKHVMLLTPRAYRQQQSQLAQAVVYQGEEFEASAIN